MDCGGLVGIPAFTFQVCITQYTHIGKLVLVRCMYMYMYMAHLGLVFGGGWGWGCVGVLGVVASRRSGFA